MILLAWWCVALADPGARPVGDWVRQELDAALAVWPSLGHAPHHVAVEVRDVDEVRVSSERGAPGVVRRDQGRTVDVDVRVGTPERDSTHELRGFSAYDDDARTEVRAAFAGPMEEGAFRHLLRHELDLRWRHARERWILLEGERRTRVDEEDPADDFEPRAPVVSRTAVPPLTVDAEAWADVLAGVSAVLDDSAVVIDAEASLMVGRSVRTYVDSDGARIDDGAVRARIGLSARVVADDGDDLWVWRGVDAVDPAALPDAAALRALAVEVRAEAEALRAAPRATPYSGPVWLSGRASAVFLHEVVGHRAEAHRNKSDSEGKTFLDQLGKPVMPAFVDIYDDPTLTELHGVPLVGHYLHDQEGVPASRAELVDDGVFRGFLMGRSPLAVQPHSNGHGRRSAGHAPTSRMGITVLEARGGLPEAALRARMVAELQRAGLPFGYRVDDIEGGFTLTGRVIPNAFNVRATRSWRVYADGRPDELVRGVDLVGTPLVAFGEVIAAGDTPAVFNGVCGAESGWVPVSAVAPSLLFRRLELQRKEKGTVLPPLLPKPRAFDGVADGSSR